MPKGKMLPGEQQPRLLQGYRVTTSNVTLKEVKSGHSSTKSQNVQKAEVAIEKRKEKKQSLLGKVFWWWSNDSLD
jgi:hypothetical protein